MKIRTDFVSNSSSSSFIVSNNNLTRFVKVFDYYNIPYSFRNKLSTVELSVKYKDVRYLRNHLNTRFYGENNCLQTFENDEIVPVECDIWKLLEADENCLKRIIDARISISSCDCDDTDRFLLRILCRYLKNMGVEIDFKEDTYNIFDGDNNLFDRCIEEIIKENKGK